MKLVLAIAVLIIGALAHDEAFLQDRFVEFQHTYARSYATAEEFSVRYAVFSANMERAQKLNMASDSASYGVTKFMDLTPEEFSKYHKGALSVENKPEHEIADVTPRADIPDSFDWRSKGAITPVYNQGQCGSCWAFSATETLESYNFLAGNSLTKLSMQQIVDCDTTAYGCNGGWTYAAYEYVESAGGQDTYTSYPYTAENGSCDFKSSAIGATIKSWKYVSQSASTESNMATWVADSGPLSVCVDASTWQFYNGGVISTSSNCGTQIDHCVMVTGYGSKNGMDVWNVRNSWGTDWGDSGYLYVQRGADVCAIAEVATAVTPGSP